MDFVESRIWERNILYDPLVYTILLTMNYKLMTKTCIFYRDNGKYSKHVYMPCYTRIGAYVVGLLTGYLLFIQNFTFRLPKVSVCLYICSKDDSRIFKSYQISFYYTL